MNAEPPLKTPERLAGWAVNDPIAALTIVAVGLYVTVRLGQQLFYDRFGLAPEDVGLSYWETLARAAGFATYLAITIGVPLAATTWGCIYLLRTEKDPSKRRSLIRALVGFYVFAVVLVLAVVIWGAIDDAGRVKRGDSVQSFFLWDIGIRGEPTEITWLATAPDGLAELDDHELMLLDHSGGTVTLYDVTEQKTVQVPSSTVAVSLSP